MWAPSRSSPPSVRTVVSSGPQRSLKAICCASLSACPRKTSTEWSSNAVAMRSKVASSGGRVRSTPRASAANIGWTGVTVSAVAVVAMEASSREILALHRPRDQPLHHPPVDEHVEGDNRDRGDHGGGHELPRVEHVAVDEQVEAYRDRDGGLVLDEHERVEELVPGEREREDGGGDQPGSGQSQQHAHERGHPPGPVDEGGLLQLVGQGLEEADEQPGTERHREGRVGEEQRREVIGGPQLGEHAVERDEQQRGRDQVQDQDQARHRLAAREAQPRHRVAAEARDHGGDGGHHQRGHEAVAQPDREARLGPEPGVVLPGERLGHVDAGGELDLLVGLERHAGDPPERHQDHEEEQEHSHPREGFQPEHLWFEMGGSSAAPPPYPPTTLIIALDPIVIGCGRSGCWLFLVPEQVAADHDDAEDQDRHHEEADRDAAAPAELVEGDLVGVGREDLARAHRTVAGIRGSRKSPREKFRPRITLFSHRAISTPVTTLSPTETTVNTKLFRMTWWKVSSSAR